MKSMFGFILWLFTLVYTILWALNPSIDTQMSALYALLLAHVWETDMVNKL